ncbi:hypothetical protein J6590_008393 [Homalodisca vitripennis]|nr:hypothetical protein J6590_008393 [Homalodisca vitripennis]
MADSFISVPDTNPRSRPYRPGDPAQLAGWGGGGGSVYFRPHSQPNSRTEDYPDGSYQSYYSLARPTLVGGWELDHPGPQESGDHCLNFWIGSYRNDTLEQVECLKIRPTWMSDNKLSIGGLSLTSLVWPGTHNSGCYRRGDTLSLRDTLARFVLTQDQDVWSQLVYGVRYIDVRVGFYPVKRWNTSEQISHDNSFWINHDLIKVRPLVPVLREIRQFLEKAEGEIVVLDLHRFPVGFSGRHARHNRLVELLERELREVAVEYCGEWPTLDKLWQQSPKGRLIIAYGDNEVVKIVQALQSMEHFRSALCRHDLARDLRSGKYRLEMLHPSPSPFIEKIPHCA